jgi:serine/threonine protein phosphatase PrpC
VCCFLKVFCTPAPVLLLRLFLQTSDFSRGKQVIDGKVVQVSARMSMGYADTIGRRQTMEDMLVLHGRFMDRDDRDYLAVFDGHGGDATALYCAQNLHRQLETAIRKHAGKPVDEIAPECLKAAFLDTQGEIVEKAVDAGSTGIVGLVTHDRLFVANAGDSRAVIAFVRGGRFEKGSVKRLSTDHKPDLPAEEKRIREAGGSVIKMPGGIARVNGTLAVARALGDTFLQPMVTAEPEVQERELLAANGDPELQEVLIMACDGLWDVVEDEEAFAVLDRVNCYDDPRGAAEALRDEASRKRSTDNISVVVVTLPRRQEQSKPAKPAGGRPGTAQSLFSVSSIMFCAAVFGGAWVLWRHFGDWR